MSEPDERQWKRLEDLPDGQVLEALAESERLLCTAMSIYLTLKLRSVKLLWKRLRSS